MVQIKSGLWVNPRVPEMVVKPELENLAKTYGKFWCTWQTDRGKLMSLRASPPRSWASLQIFLKKKSQENPILW